MADLRKSISVLSIAMCNSRREARWKQMGRRVRLRRMGRIGRSHLSSPHPFPCLQNWSSGKASWIVAADSNFRFGILEVEMGPLTRFVFLSDSSLSQRVK